jgi:sugar phosphate permease
MKENPYEPSENPYAPPIESPEPVIGAEFAAPPTVTRYGVLAFSVVMAVLLYLDRFAISVATPAILDELRIDKGQMGLAMSAFFWAYALTQVPSGWLADRWGGRVMLTTYVIAWSIVMVGLGLAQGLIGLIVFRLLLGISQAGAYPTTAGFLKNWFPLSRRGFANSAVSMGGRSGGLLTMAITPVLMLLVGTSLGYSTGRWRVVFVFYGALGLVWAIFFWRWFRNTPDEHASCNDSERSLIEHGRPPAPAKGEEPSAAVPWREMLTSGNLWLLSLINFTINVGWIFLATWMPTYLKEVHSVELWLAGAMTAITGLAGMAGSVSGGLATDALVRRYGLVWGRRLPGIIASSGAGLLYAACLGIDNVYLLVVMFAGAYYLIDLGLGSIWSTYQDIGGRHVATVLGFANMCGNFGAAIFAGVIGYLAEGGNWTTVFVISCGSFTVTLVCWLFVDPRIPLTKKSDS